MKRWLKILLWIIATPIALLLIALATYVIINQQGVIEPFDVGNPKANTKILIASQGSNFKNKLVENLVSQLNDNETYLSIVDCTMLGNENATDWDAVIIIHTMQIHFMPKEVEKFLQGANDPSNIMLVSTSGAGDEVVETFNVDAISSASREVAIPQIVKWLNEKLDEKIQIDKK
jgi:hypothetical protein